MAAIVVALFSTLPPGALGTTGVLVAASAISTAGNRTRGPLVLAGVASGLIWVALAAGWWLDRRMDADGGRVEAVVVGEVASFPRRDGNLTRFDLAVDGPAVFDAGADTSPADVSHGLVRVNCYRCNLEFRLGETWRLRLRLKGIHGLANPGLFDYERWAFQRRLVASGSLVEGKGNQRIAATRVHPVSPAYRDRLHDFLGLVLGPGSGLGIIRAVTLGVRHDITPEAWQTFQRTGTGHLVAISGLHVSLVFGFVYGLARVAARAFPPLLLRFAAQRIAAVAALPAAIYYAWLAGLSLPTQRAVIMLCVFFAAFVLGRRVMGWHTFLVALFAVVLVDPLAPLSHGFWLSFGAVSAIVVYAGYRRRLRDAVAVDTADRSRLSLRVRTMLGDWVGVQAAVSAVMLPMGVLFFGQLALASPLVNLVAIPYFGLAVVPPALAGVLAWTLDLEAIARWLLLLAGTAAQAMQELLGCVAKWPLVSVDVDLVDGVRLVAAALLAATLRWRWRGGAAAVCLSLAIASGRPSAVDHGEFRLVVLDVGQGLAAIVQTQEHALQFDAGVRYSASYDMGNMVVNPSLDVRRIDNLERLVISHGDNDHAGGAPAVLEAHPEAILFSSEPVPGYTAVPCLAGTRWTRDGVSFEFLSPEDFGPRRENDRSCVLGIESPYGRALVTGDIEARAERRLVSTMSERLAADVLVIPHHGSRTSSTASFLGAVAPTVSIISRSLTNSFGHPHPDVIARLRRLGTEILDTALDGQVDVHVAARGISVAAHRRESRPMWRSLPRAYRDDPAW